MAQQCHNCRKHYQWTRPKCPYCRYANPWSPRAIAIYLLTAAVTCAAIWCIFRAAMEREDSAAGVVPQPPHEDSVLKQIFRTPEPAKGNDVNFSQ